MMPFVCIFSVLATPIDLRNKLFQFDVDLLLRTCQGAVLNLSRVRRKLIAWYVLAMLKTLCNEMVTLYGGNYVARSYW